MMIKYNDKWMQVAINEAKLASNFSEVPVGAALIDIKSDKLISKSGNNIIRKSHPLAHAEIEVINKAVRRLKRKNLSDTAVYVTLEPCAMCAAAISEARIAKIYFGAYDIKKGSIENGIRIFSQNSYFRPEIYGGILETDCSKILKDFFHKLRNHQ